MTGIAIKFESAFGDSGVRYFSIAMVINTALCALLAVTTARRFSNPKINLPLGLAMTAASCALALATPTNAGLILFATFVATLGEIIFTTVSGYILYDAIPEVKKPGRVFGYVLLVQSLARVLGASLSFLLLKSGAMTLAASAACLLPLLLLRFIPKPHSH